MWQLANGKLPLSDFSWQLTTRNAIVLHLSLLCPATMGILSNFQQIKRKIYSEFLFLFFHEKKDSQFTFPIPW
jgi:hypothetical protein